MGFASIQNCIDVLIQQVQDDAAGRPGLLTECRREPSGFLLTPDFFVSIFRTPSTFPA